MNSDGLDTCWNQSPFGYQYPPGYNRGMVRPDRKWFTTNFMGGSRERMAISQGENVSVYWHVLNFPLAPRDSQADQIVPIEDMAIVALTATASVDEDFPNQTVATRIMLIVDQDIQLAWDRAAINNGNRFGTAGQPFYTMRPPIYTPDYASILVTAGNLSSSSNTTQLCFIGLQSRKKTHP